MQSKDWAQSKISLKENSKASFNSKDNANTFLGYSQT